ncbi:unnamed protein product [Linum tenue]|uniref:F-box domain-containing protein n=1 Tax=Linum tenue TaxID=586396 RepID=A0AAV0IQ11_9ROSI|nr:unnamed protein product [Linum tenue]
MCGDDRLTHLPEPILCHILSFLDTKSTVQTSVLSRGWNRTWKHVPALDLHTNFFRQAAEFDRFVSKVLSLRYDDLKLRKVFYYGGDGSLPKDKGSMSLQVVDYALSHDVEELALHRNIRDETYWNFSVIFSDYCDTNSEKRKKKKKTNSHLKALDLDWINLDHGFATCSGFPMLTTLTLRSCPFGTARGLTLTNFPCLKNLSMNFCYRTEGSGMGRKLKIHGPQLLSLKLELMACYEIEIYAPELETFTLCEKVTTGTVGNGFFDSAPIPDLDRADIELKAPDPGMKRLDRTVAGEYLRSLFQYVQSAKNLKLRSSSTVVILNCMRDEILEQHPSPFKRMESLILPDNKLHDKVIDYFFEASSCKEPNIFVGDAHGRSSMDTVQ